MREEAKHSPDYTTLQTLDKLVCLESEPMTSSS